LTTSEYHQILPAAVIIVVFRLDASVLAAAGLGSIGLSISSFYLQYGGEAR
jgi:hypothetical protein